MGWLKETAHPLRFLQRVGSLTIDQEKKTPLRSCASSENSFTEVSAGSDTKVAVSVWPAHAICAMFCTKSPVKLFSTSRSFVRPIGWLHRMSHETSASTSGPSISALTTSW